MTADPIGAALETARCIAAEALENAMRAFAGHPNKYVAEQRALNEIDAGITAHKAQCAAEAHGPTDAELEALARKHGTGGWQTLPDMVRFARAVLAIKPQPKAAEGDALKFNDAIRIASGCSDYGGGYRGTEHFEAYQHGIATVLASLEAAAAIGLQDTQVRALHIMGGTTPNVQPKHTPPLPEELGQWLTAIGELYIAMGRPPFEATEPTLGVVETLREAAKRLAAPSPAPAPQLPEGWRLSKVSDGDIRVYGPDKESWLIRKDSGEGFYDFIHRFFDALASQAPAPVAEDEGDELDSQLEEAWSENEALKEELDGLRRKLGKPVAWRYRTLAETDWTLAQLNPTGICEVVEALYTVEEE